MEIPKDRYRTPPELFARIVESAIEGDYMDARETADSFDTEGPIGKYKLVEEGTITIEKAFVPKSE